MSLNVERNAFRIYETLKVLIKGKKVDLNHLKIRFKSFKSHKSQIAFPPLILIVYLGEEPSSTKPFKVL